jgi:eukaryotic-like serine/threonine-protein kinase
MGHGSQREPRFQFCDFELNATTGELSRNGDKLSLQEKPLNLLLALLERPGQLITRDELKRKLCLPILLLTSIRA